ncbi:unnamed protein product, partial [Pylaiella littoralis]
KPDCRTTLYCTVVVDSHNCTYPLLLEHTSYCIMIQRTTVAYLVKSNR